jgi:adenosylcobinamide-GDP ribazoletransferase
LLAVGGGILLTGALHEDGLADCADGFGGGKDKEHKLKIMRDSAIGSYGALALILSVGLRVSATANIDNAWKALIAAHCLGRGALPLAMHFLPPASASGVAAGAGKPSQAEAGFALLTALLIAGLLSPVSILPAALAALLFGWFAYRQLGGHSGDVLGGMEQLAETAALLAALP